MKSALPLIPAALLGAIVAFPPGPPGDLSTRAQARVDALSAADDRLGDSVLKARAGITNHYDDITRALVNLHVELRTVRAAMGAVALAPSSREAVDERLRAADQLIQAKEQQVEQAKTELALLRNSSRFFPVAAGQLIASARPVQPALADSVENLLREVAIFASNATVERGAAILEQCRALQSLDVNDAALGDARLLLVRHATIIVEHTRRVDRLVRDVLRMPVQGPAGLALRVFLEEVEPMMAWRRRAQAGAAGLAGIFVLLSLLLFVRDHRRARDAAASHEHALRSLKRAVFPRHLHDLPGVPSPSTRVHAQGVLVCAGACVADGEAPSLDGHPELATRIDALARAAGWERAKRLGHAWVLLPAPQKAVIVDDAVALARSLVGLKAGADFLAAAVHQGAFACGVTTEGAWELTGDAVEAAWLLQRAAVPGDVVVSDPAHRQMRHRPAAQETELVEAAHLGSIRVHILRPMQSGSIDVIAKHDTA